MSGYYFMHRGWQDNEMFADEPYTEREAWEWLIMKASYDGKQRYNINGEPVVLSVGELSFSYSYMAKKWQWSKQRVGRFLDSLQKWNAIRTENGRGQTVISICEYTKYQNKPDAKRTENGRETDAKQDEYKEVKEVNNTTDDITRARREIPKEIGWDQSPNGYWNLSSLDQWFANGWDYDKDILPTIKRLVARKQGAPPTSLKYFEQAIADAHAQRLTPLPKGRVNETNSKLSTTARNELAKQQALRDLGVEAPSC